MQLEMKIFGSLEIIKLLSLKLRMPNRVAEIRNELRAAFFPDIFSYNNFHFAPKHLYNFSLQKNFEI